jgi:hypothetical protein
MVETHKAEYSYYRADEGGHEPILPGSEEFSLLEEHWDDDSQESYLCIAEDEYGTPQAHTFDISPFLEIGNLPRHPAAEGACYYREKENKAYRNFLVSDNNAVLPAGSGFSKFIDRMSGDRITYIADTNENGIPDSGDTGYTRRGERVDDIELTSPITEYDEVEAVYGHEINAVPAKGSFKGSDPLSLALHVLIPSDDSSAYDVRHFDSASGEALAVAVGNSSTEYLDAQYEAAGEMGAAISDNPVIAGAITAGMIVASVIHPYARAAVSGLAYLGAVGGALYMVYDRAVGIYNYAAGKAKDVIMGRHDFDCMLWMAGATAFKGMTVTEAIQAPVKVLEAYNATIVGVLRVLRGGTTPLLVYAGGGVAADAEVAVAAATFPEIPALADIFPSAMAMSAESAVSIDTANGGRKFIDTESFPNKKTSFDDWLKSKSYEAQDSLSELLNKTAEYHIDNSAESIADDAIGRISEFEERMEVLKTLYRHAPDDIRAMIDTGMEEISTVIRRQPESTSPESIAELAENQYQRFSRHFDDVMDAAEGVFRNDKDRGMIYFLSDNPPVVKINGTQIDIPSGLGMHPRALKSASKNGLLDKYLPETFDILLNGADANGSTGHSVRWSLKGNPDIGEVRFVSQGKRVYFSNKVGDGRIHILECGKKGSKKIQDADIARAKGRLDELVKRFEAGESLYD